MTPRRLTRWPLALLLFVATIGFPAPAWAHAHLRKSEPSANGRVTSAPQYLRFWFSEAPELSLTTVTLLDAAGKVIGLSAPERDPDGAMAVRVAITGVVAAGRYTIRWRTAGADGHPSSGTFAFVVAAPAVDTASVSSTASGIGTRGGVDTIARPPSAGASATKDQTSDADALTPAWIVARAIAFLALLAVVGAVTFRLIVLARASDIDLAARAEIASEVAGRAVLLSAVLLLATGAKLYLQNRMMSGSAASDIAHMESMSMETHWGAAWRLQIAAVVAASIGFAMAWRRISGGWVVAALACMALASGVALSGHAAAAPEWRTIAIVDDALHILGASAWLGSLLWLLAVGVRATKLVSPGRAQRAASLVTAFSPVALGSAALVILTGVVSAWLRLGSIPALWSSSYGQVLLVKLLFLAGVIGT
ncbi:MAG TPA: copper resistance protein CopC, partial [Gemmatimonadaceae bacterium]|nr:copper resistance protein CopC [Gemmatimonadaceae bacterium]